MELSHASRFDRTLGHGGQVFAPLTIGCPSMIEAVDMSVFKKSIEEKSKIYTHKKRIGKTKKQKLKTVFKDSF